MRLLLVTHALTAWVAEGRYQGQTDTLLSAAGQRQARLLAARLAGKEIAACHASDLRRAWDTAAAITAGRPLICQSEPRLREMHFGAWEGLTYTEIQRKDPHALADWEANELEVAPPGGETVAQVAQRIGEALAMLASAYTEPEQTILLVGHRGAFQVLLCLALGMPPARRWQLRLEPASVSELFLYPRGGVLNRLNDTHHLREGTDHAG